MQDVRDLSMMIESSTPIIVLETNDEVRAIELLTRVAIEQRMGFYCWSITEGLTRLGFGLDVDAAQEPENPSQVIKKIKTHQSPAIYALCDYHPYLPNNPEHIRLLKDIAIHHDKHKHTLILISHEMDVPPELKHYCAKFSLSLPSDTQIMSIVREEAGLWSKENNGKRLKTDQQTLKAVVKNLRGLSRLDVKQLARGIIRDDGAITESDLPEINRAKFELMDMDGILSFEYDTERFSDVGGLHQLKDWLKNREQAFLNADNKSGADCPKGVLLLGIQGGGKSLAAKAVAGLWRLPLLRLDVGNLYNKYIGETEKNLRKSLAQAELMSPCVLWVDEIEKGFAQGDNDDGTSRRLMGTMLTWMAEHAAKVFIVATSNDVSRLPPELLRKGRLDEIFFVDLPAQTIREDIFSIHLKKRQLTPGDFSIPRLAEQAEGFSGAEIEQAVVAAIYSSQAQQQPLSDKHLSHEIDSTYPLSVVMEEQIAQLRAWAKERTVMAG